VAVRYWLTFCAAAVLVNAAVVLALGVGVGDGAIGLVHPAAKTTASIATANVPAKNDFFMVKPRKALYDARTAQRGTLSVGHTLREVTAYDSELKRGASYVML
jgi:hypothetical protein